MLLTPVWGMVVVIRKRWCRGEVTDMKPMVYLGIFVQNNCQQTNRKVTLIMVPNEFRYLKCKMRGHEVDAYRKHEYRTSELQSITVNLKSSTMEHGCTDYQLKGNGRTAGDYIFIFICMRDFPFSLDVLPSWGQRCFRYCQGELFGFHSEKKYVTKILWTWWIGYIPQTLKAKGFERWVFKNINCGRDLTLAAESLSGIYLVSKTKDCNNCSAVHQKSTLWNPLILRQCLISGELVKPTHQKRK